MAETIAPAPAIDEPVSAEWRRWGPYLSDRQWGTVREDYSASGSAWDSFPHDHARSRAYRWGEDGLFGLSDDGQRLCLALALWNGADPILKERLFGLTGNEGNHGEDVKEVYYYLDATPSHSYLNALYKYPQRAYLYGALNSEENRRRGKRDPEYELIDTGVFVESRYFDVVVEYAKASPEDLLIRISATNRGPDAAPLHLLPTLWFRNTWAWGRDDSRPTLSRAPQADLPTIEASHPDLGRWFLTAPAAGALLFTENETNAERLWGIANTSPYVKDGINDTVVHGAADRVNPGQTGTKAAVHVPLEIAPGATETIVLRFSTSPPDDPLAGADAVFAARIAEADRFYAAVTPDGLSADERSVQRQAFAGLVWTKQFYGYDVQQWLEGDPGSPPPSERSAGRNRDWRHVINSDVISMPDTWEYPWYAAWDLAFHCIPFGLIDPGFAKDQLRLLLRGRYMHPNGQLPAYEWAFGDVNPPVHVWAALRLFLTERERMGTTDKEFLARVFQKLLLNFSWWVNRKDGDGRNVFQGGFLGLDNISVFDRSANLPPNVRLEQSDATAWMATYCLAMGWAALELTAEDPAYEDVAITFLDHFFAIGGAINGLASGAVNLWHEEDGFYYDELCLPTGESLPLRVRSLVGLLPIIAAVPVGPRLRRRGAEFTEHLQTTFARNPALAALAPAKVGADGERYGLLTIVPEDRLRRLLRRMLDPNEFLGDFGIRSISKAHEQPYVFTVAGRSFDIQYQPAESATRMFGGNSNWRGPIWFPINFLLVEGLRRLHRYYGNDFRIEFPTGSGQEATLAEIADDLARRLISIFLRGPDGRRPVYGGAEIYQTDPHWRDHVLFYEYFHGDNGAGLGASHQTGWTALVAALIDQVGRDRAAGATGNHSSVYDAAPAH